MTSPEGMFLIKKILFKSGWETSETTFKASFLKSYMIQLELRKEKERKQAENTYERRYIYWIYVLDALLRREDLGVFFTLIKHQVTREGFWMKRFIFVI